MILIQIKSFWPNPNTNVAPWSPQGTKRHDSHMLPYNNPWHLHWALHLIKLFTRLIHCDPLNKLDRISQTKLWEPVQMAPNDAAGKWHVLPASRTVLFPLYSLLSKDWVSTGKQKSSTDVYTPFMWLICNETVCLAHLLPRYLLTVPWRSAMLLLP